MDWWNQQQAAGIPQQGQAPTLNDFSSVANEANFAQNPQQPQPQPFQHMTPAIFAMLSPGEQFRYAASVGHAAGSLSFTDPQAGHSLLPPQYAATAGLQHPSATLQPSPYPPFGTPAPAPTSYTRISRRNMGASGQSPNGAPLTPAHIHGGPQAPRLPSSTASEAHEQLLRARQRQAIDSNRQMQSPWSSPQVNTQGLRAQTPLVYGHQQQNGAHASPPASLVLGQSTRPTAPPHISPPRNDLQQAPVSHMSTFDTTGRNNMAAPDRRWSPYDNGTNLRATARPPSAPSPSLSHQMTVTRNLPPSMGADSLAAQSPQQSVFANIPRQNTVMPASSFMSSSRQYQNSPHTAPPSALSSHMPALSRPIHSQASPIHQVQKRPANETTGGVGQAQKRQATTVVVAAPHTERYQTPDAMQQLLAAKGSSHGAIDTAPPLPNLQAQLNREKEAYQNELFERQRIAEEARLERERRVRRKEALKKDPSALYRYYDEFLEYFPLQQGEYRSPYLSRLLANQRMPMEPESDLGVAITYAREFWDIYMEYPKDVKRAADVARARIKERRDSEHQAGLDRMRSGRATR